MEMKTDSGVKADSFARSGLAHVGGQIAFALFLLCGCSSPGVYDSPKGWFVCENARPLYAVDYDVFYLASDSYDGREESVVAQREKIKVDVTRKFGPRVRVFAPVFHDGEDIERAFWHYLDVYDDGGYADAQDAGRPFAFVGEGKGAECACDFVRREERRLRDRGLIGCWFSPMATNGFLSAEMVSEIGAKVRRMTYQKVWGRDGQ